MAGFAKAFQLNVWIFPRLPARDIEKMVDVKSAFLVSAFLAGEIGPLQDFESPSLPARIAKFLDV